MRFHAASAQAAGNTPGKWAPLKTVSRSQAVSDEGPFCRSSSAPLDLETAAQNHVNDKIDANISK